MFSINLERVENINVYEDDGKTDQHDESDDDDDDDDEHEIDEF